MEDSDTFDLWLASSIGDIEYVKENASYNNVNLVNSGAWTCLMYASYYDHAEIVIYLLSHGAEPQYSGNDRIRTSLMLAASCGHVDVVEIFLSLIKDDIQDSKGFTALCHAVQFGHFEICQTLLESGSDPNIVVNSKKHWTPILIATEEGKLISILSLSFVNDNLTFFH